MEPKFEGLETVDDLSILNGHAFEEYLTQLFGDLGYDAEKTPGSGDFGADLVLAHGDERIVVQAKQYAGDVGFDAVKEVHFAKSHYKATGAWVVCTSGFTAQAEEAAAGCGIELYGAERLGGLLALHREGGKLVDEDPARLAREREQVVERLSGLRDGLDESMRTEFAIEDRPYLHDDPDRQERIDEGRSAAKELAGRLAKIEWKLASERAAKTRELDKRELELGEEYRRVSSEKREVDAEVGGLENKLYRDSYSFLNRIAYAGTNEERRRNIAALKPRQRKLRGRLAEIEKELEGFDAERQRALAELGARRKADADGVRAELDKARNSLVFLTEGARLDNEYARMLDDFERMFEENPRRAIEKYSDA